MDSIPLLFRRDTDVGAERPPVAPSPPPGVPLPVKEATRGVHIRLPADVYLELEAEAKEQRLLLTHYCYQLVVKRPVKVIDLPAQAKAELAKVPVLEKNLAVMTANWETRKGKYAGLETKLADQTKLLAGLSKVPTLEKQVAALTKDRAAVAAERDALKATLAALRKRIGSGRYVVKCPSCREKVELDLTEEMGLKQPDKPKG